MFCVQVRQGVPAPTGVVPRSPGMGPPAGVPARRTVAPPGGSPTRLHAPTPWPACGRRESSSLLCVLLALRNKDLGLEVGRARIRKQITEPQKQHADTCCSNASKYQLTIKYAATSALLEQQVSGMPVPLHFCNPVLPSCIIISLLGIWKTAQILIC